MSFFVSTYEKKLRVPRSEAWIRIFWTALSMIVAFSVVTAVLLFFPWNGSYEQKVELMSGNHVLVTAVIDGDVTVNQIAFQKISAGKPTLVAATDKSIVYYTNVDGISYRYDQARGHDLRYSVTSGYLEGNDLVRVLKRNSVYVLVISAILPGLVLALCGIAFYLATNKNHGTHWNPSYRSLFGRR